MLLTIGIVTYNRLFYLKQMVSTIERSKILDRVDVELIILNNGSTDGTADYLDQISNELKIKLIYMPENTLGSEPFLTLISAALGEWIILPGDDDLFNVDHLSELPTYLCDLAREFTLVSFGADTIDEFGEENFQRYAPPIENSQGELLAKLFCENPFCMPSTIFRRSVTFGWNMPGTITTFDWSLWILSLSSGKIFKKNERLIKYRQHPGQIQKTYLQTVWEIDKLITFNKLITESNFQKWLAKQDQHSLEEFLEYLVTLKSNRYQSLSSQLIFLWLGLQIVTSNGKTNDYVIEVLIRLGLDPRYLESVFNSRKQESRYYLALSVLEKTISTTKTPSDDFSKINQMELYQELLLMQRQQEKDRQVTEFELRVLLVFRNLTKSKTVGRARKLKLIRKIENNYRSKQGL
jgi:glycosyltransferase involved in cell wall biosynthesis